MLMKLKILETFKNSDLFNRFFKVKIFSKQNTNVVQFNSGGDDYNPPPKCEGLGGTMGNNPNNGFVCAWRDEVERVAAPGEKRIYAVNPANNVVVAQLHLKNDGKIVLLGGTLLINMENIQSTGEWVHNGNFTNNGSITANHIEALDGADGVLDKPQVTKGIVTGGS